MSARLAQAATQQNPQCEPVPPQGDGVGLASGSVSSESQCSRSGLSHSHRAWPWAPIPARPHPTRPLPDRPRATVHIQRQRPVHRVNVEKLLSKNVLQLGLQKKTFSVFAKTQANNKTADTSFLQNQPVTARGINNKNLQPVAARGINNKNFRRRRPPSVRRQNVRVTSRRAASCCCRVFP